MAAKFRPETGRWCAACGEKQPFVPLAPGERREAKPCVKCSCLDMVLSKWLVKWDLLMTPSNRKFLRSMGIATAHGVLKC